MTTLRNPIDPATPPKAQGPLFVLICDGILDQVCEGLAVASKERKSLEAMGFKVTVLRVGTWEQADVVERKLS